MPVYMPDKQIRSLENQCSRVQFGLSMSYGLFSVRARGEALARLALPSDVQQVEHVVVRVVPPVRTDECVYVSP